MAQNLDRLAAKMGFHNMSVTALLFLNDYAEGDVEKARSLLSVGGITLLERQLRQLKAAGVDHALLVSNNFPDLIHRYVLSFTNIPTRIEVIEQNHLDRGSFSEDERYLIIGEGVILAQSAITHMASLTQNALMVLPKDVPMFGLSATNSITASGGEKRAFASLASIDRGLLVQALEDDSFQDRPLGIILAFMVNRQAGLITLTNPIPLGGGEPPLVWRPVTAKNQTGRVTRMLARDQGNSQPDFITNLVHGGVENLLVSLLSWIKIPVVGVRLTSVVIGLIASWMIYFGALGTGLATAIFFTLVWGAGDKMGKVQLNPEYLTPLWKVIGWLVELGWFVAIANMLMPFSGDLTPWVLMVTAWLFMLAGEGALSGFTVKSGQTLWTRSMTDKTIGLFVATRTSRIWAIILIGAGLNWGYVPWGVAAFSALSFFLIQGRINKQFMDSK